MRPVIYYHILGPEANEVTLKKLQAIDVLTHWGLHKIVDIMQTTFSNKYIES